MITNFHVVEDAKHIKVRARNSVFDAQLLKTDPSRDLALLKVDGQFVPLAIAKDKSASLGEAVFTIGFPNIVIQGLQPKYTDGKISSLSGLRDNMDCYQISVPIQSGNSGGPLMDLSGNVIGVVVAKLNDLRVLLSSGSVPQNVNYALKSELVREFLSKVSDVKLKANQAILNTEEVLKATEESVVLVLVYK